MTDIDGKYSITIEGVGGVLEFSYIGMKKQEIAIIDQRVSMSLFNPILKYWTKLLLSDMVARKKKVLLGLSQR